MKNANILFGKGNSGPGRELVLLAVGLVLFSLITLGVRPPGVPDEGRYASIAYAMYASGDYVTPMLNGVPFLDKPVLYYWLEALGFHLFGTASWVMRIPPMLLGVATTLSVFLTGCCCFNRSVGWIAALILGTSPFWYGMSQYANMDIEIASWISMCLFVMVAALNASGKRRCLLFCLAYALAAMGTLTKGLIGLALPSLVLAVYCLVTRQWELIRSIHFCKGMAIYIVLCLPWMVLMECKYPGFFHYFFVTQQFSRFLFNHFNNVQPVWFYEGVLLAGLFPWSLMIPSGFWYGYRCLKENGASTREKSVVLFLMIWSVALFLFFSYPASKPIGYILPVLPPLSLLIACGLKRWISDQAKSRISIFFMVVLSISVSLSLVFLGTKILSIKGVDITEKARLPLCAAGVAGCVFSLLAWFGRVRIHTLRCLYIFPAALCLGLPAIVGSMDRRSLLPVVDRIRPCTQPQTRIVYLDHYYYDLPLLLQMKKPVLVVANWGEKADIMASDNWKRELFTGLEYRPEARKWLIADGEFLHLLQAKDAPVMIIAGKHSRGFLERLKSLEQIASYHGTYIFSHQKQCVLTYDRHAMGKP